MLLNSSKMISDVFPIAFSSRRCLEVVNVFFGQLSVILSDC